MRHWRGWGVAPGVSCQLLGFCLGDFAGWKTPQLGRTLVMHLKHDLGRLL